MINRELTKLFVIRKSKKVQSVAFEIEDHIILHGSAGGPKSFLEGSYKSSTSNFQTVAKRSMNSYIQGTNALPVFLSGSGLVIDFEINQEGVWL